MSAPSLILYLISNIKKKINPVHFIRNKINKKKLLSLYLTALRYKNEKLEERFCYNHKI